MRQKAHSLVARVLSVLLLSFASAAALAQTTQPGTSALEVSLLTIGPGPIFWERFGHNAIVIRDHEAGIEVAFNYGIFDFEHDSVPLLIEGLGGWSIRH